jgi:hypothetical protein
LYGQTELHIRNGNVGTSDPWFMLALEPLLATQCFGV